MLFATIQVNLSYYVNSDEIHSYFVNPGEIFSYFVNPVEIVNLIMLLKYLVAFFLSAKILSLSMLLKYFLR